MAELLKGKPLADKISEQIVARLAELSPKLAGPVTIAAVQIGGDPATEVYVRNQQKQAEKHGMQHRHHHLSDSTTQAELIEFIQGLNDDPSITGIILQTPMPDHIDTWQAQCAIAVRKDIEGIGPENLGLLVYNRERLAPCTALAAIKLIESTGIKTVGAEVVIVGRSAIVGKPAALLLLEKKLSATVTICHTGTSKVGKLEEHVRRADIVIAAMGVPEAIPGEWIKPGATVIDVGINQTDDGLVGDVQFAAAEQRAGIITPVPGGVGAVTTRLLLWNAVEAAAWQLESAAKTNGADEA